MRNKLKKNLIKHSDGITVLSFILCFFSFIISWNANFISRSANNIADEANKISKAGNGITNTQYSLEKIKFLDERWKNSIQSTSSLYDKLMEEGSIFSSTRIKIQQNEKIEIGRNLERYVDQFEFIGHMYCEGFIRKKDIKANLKGFLEYACNNEQIYSTFRSGKNAFKHLCFDIVLNSKLGTLYEKKNECTFLDTMMYQFKDTYKNLGIPIVF